jgi:hypothetical protein
MLLGLAILFFWLAAVLLFVAFHPLGGDDLGGKPSDVIASVHTAMSNAG